jgi:hypothetical protein
MCVANKFRIVDQKLLDWQLSVQKIRHQPHHDPVLPALRAAEGGCDTNCSARAVRV